MAGDRYLADDTGKTGAGGSARARSLASKIRDEAALKAATDARQLRLVAQFADEVVVEAGLMLSGEGRGPSAPGELIESAVVGEVQAVLGIAEGPAGRMVDLARRLTAVLPETLAALECGRLDLIRATALATATDGLKDAAAREVQDRMLAVAGDAPWDGLSPRSWRDRVERTASRVDADRARRRREEEYARRAVRSQPTVAGMAELIITADAAAVAMAEQVLTDLAQARHSRDAEGEYVTMDQRRVDAFVDLFCRVRDGHGLPSVSVRRVRELGLVLHADTFFGHGPAAANPGEVRGLTGQVVLDPVTAREHAEAMVYPAGTAGRSGAVNVLLADRAGALRRVVRFPDAPAGGWTRQLLEEAVRARLDDLPALWCDSYSPTVAIVEHVRARNPHCAAYNCPRRAHRCDLDHDVPWPRGPTAAENLGPRCRRQHEIKTRGLVRTRLHPDGSLDTRMLSGLVVTTRPEPLPGHAPGEGYATQATDAA
jgi:hypothetical protein